MYLYQTFFFFHHQNGPNLPNESGIHETSSTTEIPAASSINSTLSHAMNATLNQTAHEQKAKPNETEKGFKAFQTVSPATGGGPVPPDNGAAQQLPENNNQEGNHGDARNSDDRMNPSDGDEEPQGNSNAEEGGDGDGQDGGDASSPASEGLSRVLQLLRSNILSDNQRRKLVQRLLKTQGRDYGGD